MNYKDVKKAFISILIFISYHNLCYAAEDCSFKVLKVLDGDTVYIDFNKNGIADAEERVRINGIDTFEVKPTVYLDWQMKRFNLTQDEALGLGYLGKEFAKKELLNKHIKAEYTAERKFDANNRPLMSIYYDCNRRGKCKNYEQEVLKAGLATVYAKSNIAEELRPYENWNKIRANMEKAHQLNLVVLNLKNGKYHKTACENGWIASRQELIKQSKKYSPAACCYKLPDRKHKNYTHKNIKLKNDINLYFVDPTQNEFPQNECTSDNCKALLNVIRSANYTIDFALYGFNEQDDILDALIQAQNRGVKIRGVVDKDEAEIYNDTKKLFKYFKELKTDTVSSIAKKEQYDKFTRARNALMHNKFFIVDDKYVWTGSTNVSSRCMTFHANSAILINSSQIANLYKKEFEQMFVNGKFHNDKELIINNEHILLNNGKTEISIYFSPKTEAITNYVIPIIRNSKKSIHISMFYLTHRKIVEDLVNAKARGVDVKIILDGDFVADGYSPHEKLRNANIPVKIENWNSRMHMKNAVIDNHISILGSTNWTSTAELVNDENMLIVVDDQIAKEVENNFQKMWNKIPNNWLYLTPEFRVKPRK